MVMKRKEMEQPSKFNRYSNNSQFQVDQSLNDDMAIEKFRANIRLSSRSIRKSDAQPFKNIRYSSKHGCYTITSEPSSSSSLTSFQCDLSQNIVRGNAHIPEIYTRDLISTIGSADRYPVDRVPNFEENSSIINDSKNLGLDLSLKM
ncbi:unnamed protein product [Arabis nemorensis]|uniref:Uncharacterized protein n=1 Tax=Arabis nemorensis TaxID=586526 RepID=A0A565CND7_9BRAS|nr:unnamed protein product [Arabis nemorensis]